MTYVWFLNGSQLLYDDRYIVNASQMVLQNVQKSDNESKISCKAQESPELPSDASEYFTIQPECKISVVVLIRLNESYNILRLYFS